MSIITEILLCTVLFLILINWVSKYKSDSTDGKQKSGLLLFKDHGTGIEYVGTLMGGLTPRLDSNGKILTNEKDK